MNVQTHKATPTFPLGYHYKTEAQAISSAIDYSLKYTDHFIYVILSLSSGKFRLDYIGINYSDERLIATYRKGEKTL